MSLLKNAILSIDAGVEDYEYGGDSKNLSAVRNVYAGVLLLFKEKLVRLSPEYDKELLIKKKLIPVRGENGDILFRSHGKNTVDVSDIEARFKSLGVSVDWARFYEIRSLRNTLEHYYTDKPTFLIREILAKSFLIIRDFLINELNETPVSIIAYDVWPVLLSVEEVFSAEERACKDSFIGFNWKYKIINQAIMHAKCYFCESTLLQLVEHKPFDGTHGDRCLFEYYRTKIRCNCCGEFCDLFSEFLEKCISDFLYAHSHIAVTEGGLPIVEKCPECSMNTFVFEEGCCVACDYKPDSRGRPMHACHHLPGA